VTRILVVNADDFGRTSGINRGIARAHEHGIVTSASLMVRYRAAADAAAYAHRHRDFAVGLHLDFGEWVYRGDRWAAVYEVEQTVDEAERQLEEFRRLVGGDPSHVDSHQHVHREEPALSICRDLADGLRVPLRHFAAVNHVGAFYGQAQDGSPLPQNISVEGLVALIHSLPEGVTELCCHPGESDWVESPYLHERQVELETLCDPRVRVAIKENAIELRSFRDVQGL
jgi:chitin disaccharide deacetylase